jgi:hypothetical protein
VLFNPLIRWLVGRCTPQLWQTTGMYMYVLSRIANTCCRVTLLKRQSGSSTAIRSGFPWRSKCSWANCAMGVVFSKSRIVSQSLPVVSIKLSNCSLSSSAYSGNPMTSSSMVSAVTSRVLYVAVRQPELTIHPIAASEDKTSALQSHSGRRSQKLVMRCQLRG